MDFDKPIQRFTQELRVMILDNLEHEARLTLIQRIRPNTNTRKIIEKFNKLNRLLACEVGLETQRIVHLDVLNKIKPLYTNYLWTLKNLSKTTDKTNQSHLKSRLQTIQKTLHELKLDQECLAIVEAFIRTYSFENRVELSINVGTHFLISHIQARDLLQIVTTEELKKVSNLLKPVLEAAYWFDEKICTPDDNGDFITLLQKYSTPLKTLLGKRFEQLEDLLVQKCIPTLFQIEVEQLTQESSAPITGEKGFNRYQSCLNRIACVDLPDPKGMKLQQLLGHLKKAGLSKKDGRLVIQFSRKIYKRAKARLEKAGLFKRAEKHSLLPGMSFLDI